jgi:hypothetical protein
MFSPTAPNDHEDLRRLLKRINDAWRQGRAGELGEYFHEDMVIVGPGLQPLGKGREVCVKSYQDFAQSATILDYKDSDPAIEVWGDTAVASFGWEITYEMKSQTSRDVGQDLFVFRRENHTWRAVWRAVLFSPQPAQP